MVISGINGFVGKHLCRALHESGVSVIGVGYDNNVSSEIEHLVDEYHQSDLTQGWPEIPDATTVVHLAGLAVVGQSFDSPQKYISSNSSMVTNLCEYYLRLNNKTRIIIVSSGLIYDSNQTMPITEDGVINLNSPYAISKVLNENQATYYRNRGIDCIVARPFNHIGPGQVEGFILPDFYSRISSLSGDKKVINVGNIETRRDYTDVRDIVRAYVKLALEPSLEHSVYNICSGVGLSGADIFNSIKSVLNMPDVSYTIDQSLVRPTDTPEIVGNSLRLQQELGWKPTHTIEQTIKDFVESKQS